MMLHEVFVFYTRPPTRRRSFILVEVHGAFLHVCVRVCVLTYSTTKETFFKFKDPVLKTYKDPTEWNVKENKYLYF